MEQRISVLTIGADNLPAMRTFYEDVLGWKPVAVNKDIVFYTMNGFLFSIGKRKELATFIRIPADGNGFRSVTFGYNVATETEVGRLYDLLVTKGVKILTKPTRPPFGGLFFYFADVEGNVLEIAHNPFISLDDDNNAIEHKPIGHL